MTTQQNTELQAAISIALGAYADATGKWSDCDWCRLFPSDLPEGHVQYDAQAITRKDVDNANPGSEQRFARRAFYYRQNVQDAAARAEDYAAHAVKAIGDTTSPEWKYIARENAQMCRKEEAQFGDCPTWGDFCDAVEAACDLA